MKRSLRFTILVLALAGIAVRLYTLRNLTSTDLCGSDFPIFYAGGQLVGTPQLYSAAAVREIELREAGCSQPPALFVRLPFFAGLMAPWGRIPFWTSFLLWRIATVAAVAVFIWLWPVRWEWSVLACAWSLPLAYDITQGQDSAYLLLWIAFAMTLLARSHDFAAGLALSMLAAKFHLFLLLPLLFLGRRKVLWGGAVGGAVALAACFAVQGPHWIGQFLAAIGDRGIDRPAGFFNLRGMAHGNPAVEILLAIPVVAAVVYVIRRADFQLAVAAVLAAGLLVGHQQTNSDMVLLIPSALTLAFHPQARYSKVLAIFLISPMAYFLIASPRLWEIPRFLFMIQIFLMAWEAKPLSGTSRDAAVASAPVSGARYA